MPVERLHIDEFLKREITFPLLDVRSPGEFHQAHIPGAQSLPLFSDEERAIIGTAYKQKSRAIAVDEGLKFFSSSMQSIREHALKLAKMFDKDHTPSVFYLYCWRGGMRSEAVAWLLNLYGYKIYVLQGGYKSFRRWAITQFEKERDYKIIGGFTGSGKTELLSRLNEGGQNTIDLEQLANHKGSSFGTLGMPPQPSQEMFENLLALELGMKQTEGKPIWLEDESRHIGRVHIPDPLWQKMRKSDLYFMEIPASERLDYIVKQYGKFKKNDLKEAILRIQKRLGGLETKNTLQFLEQGNIKACFEILLRYYDKLYQHSLGKHLESGGVMHKIGCKSVDRYNADAL